jgi:hypothetical protein
MSLERLYTQLPFLWKDAETKQNDQRWPKSILRNAACFSDWWTKAEIVRVAYTVPMAATPLDLVSAEKAIIEHLHSLCDPEQYPDFHRYVNEYFVIDTLNCWKSQFFTQTISRNFEVYAHWQYPNTFLVSVVTGACSS